MSDGDGMNDDGHEGLAPKEAGDKCNARRTDGSGYCGQPAGWGTDHDRGRCKFHGGSTPSQERGIIADLEDAAEHASLALKLQLKHLKRKMENGEEIDAGELDRLARTVFDRTGYGKSEKKELEHSGEVDGFEFVIAPGGDDGDA